jgi:HTH-type transcriptional regulator / antitoxin HipB
LGEGLGVRDKSIFILEFSNADVKSQITVFGGTLFNLPSYEGFFRTDRHPRQIIGWINSLNLIISELKQEISEYEQLKSGNILTFSLGLIEDLPTTLIKARIAAGLTQKDLAEKIGVQEQQIQRYESNHYGSASFDRLRTIASALKVEIIQAVMQLEIQPKF